MRTEKWTPIVGYESTYLVNALGEIKNAKTGRVLKPRDHRGYLYVVLYQDGKRKEHTIHRLVATTLLPNPDCLPQLNHKDNNKKNNRLDNLEWCSPTYNINYGTAPYRRHTSLSKQVFQYDFDGHLVGVYTSAIEASVALGNKLSRKSTGTGVGTSSGCETHINRACAEHRPFKGFFWTRQPFERPSNLEMAIMEYRTSIPPNTFPKTTTSKCGKSSPKNAITTQ